MYLDFLVAIFINFLVWIIYILIGWCLNFEARVLRLVWHVKKQNQQYDDGSWNQGVNNNIFYQNNL